MLVHVVTGEKEYVTEVGDQSEDELLSGPIRAEAKKTVKVIRRIVPGDAAKKRPAYQEHLFFPLDNPNVVDVNDRAYDKYFYFTNITGLGVLHPEGPIAKLYFRQMGRVIVPGPGSKVLV